MGMEVATTAGTAVSVIRWSEPQLTTSLEGLIAANTIWNGDHDLPVISADDQRSARQAIAAYQAFPRGSSPALVARLMGVMATAFPAARVSDKEAAARLEVYQIQLSDIDSDLLKQAFGTAANTCRFFPSVAEIRECASKLPAPARVVRAHRLRRLLTAQRDKGDPVEVVTPEQVAAIKAELGLDRLPAAAEKAAPAGAPDTEDQADGNEQAEAA